MKSGWLLILSLFLISLDQLLGLFLRHFSPHIIYKNQGIVFGWGENLPLWVLTIASLIGLAFFLWLLMKEKEWLGRLGLVGVIAGGLSNLVSRVVFGFVTDFIKISFWPAFNLADILIVVGVLLYGYSLFRHFQRKSPAA